VCGWVLDCCSADGVYKLWRIFNTVAETSDERQEDEAAVPVNVHSDELELIVQRLGVILRTAAVSHDTASGSGGRAAADFSEFLRSIETTCLAGKNASVVSSAVGQLYDDIVANVLKKVHSTDTCPSAKHSTCFFNVLFPQNYFSALVLSFVPVRQRGYLPRRTCSHQRLFFLATCVIKTWRNNLPKVVVTVLVMMSNSSSKL